MTLKEYIKKRNGVAVGNPKSLRNNLYRSLGAKNFSIFWTYWNPIFGYYLGNFIFKPLKRYFPVAIALLLTFIFCGLIHDAVTILFRGETSLFFTLWFLIMGGAVLITKHFNLNYLKQLWIIRVLINLSVISFCLLMTIYITKFLNFS